MNTENLVEIYTTDDKLHTLYQYPDYVKIFILYQEDKYKDIFVPCMEDEIFSGNDGELPNLTGVISEAEFKDKTGLAYFPSFFKSVPFCTEEDVKTFNLQDHPDINPFLSTAEMKKENEIVCKGDEVSDYDLGVEAISIESEKLRGDIQGNDHPDGTIFGMVHERGCLTYKLGAVETELETLRKETDNKIRELEMQRTTLLEKIDTFDYCIKRLIKE